MKAKKIIPMLALVAAFSGCKKSDIELPIIQSFTVNGESEEVEAAVGTVLNFSAILTDNENLQQYKIDLHDAFDGHTHNKTSLYPRFGYLNIIDISGASYTVNESELISPDAAAGPYDIIMQVLDETGNEGAFKEVVLTITRPDQAAITVSNYDLSIENSVAAGSRLTLAGTITDDADIVSVDISLSGTNGDLYDQEFEFPGGADTTWDLSGIEAQGFPIDISSTAVAGQYQLKILAVDSDGNYTITKGYFTIQ